MVVDDVDQGQILLDFVHDGSRLSLQHLSIQDQQLGDTNKPQPEVSSCEPSLLQSFQITSFYKKMVFKHRGPRYLAGVIEVEPAIQVDGVPAGHQAAVLEDAQSDRRVVACSDDIMEGVLQRHRVIVGSLVLCAVREINHITFLWFFFFFSFLGDGVVGLGVPRDRPGTKSKLCPPG